MAVRTEPLSIQQSETYRYLQAIFDGSIHGIMILRPVHDADRTIIDFEWVLANPMAGKLIGHEVEALLGERLLQTRIIPFLPDHFADLVQVAITGHMRAHQYCHREHGQVNWYDVQISQVEGGIVIRFLDITERKRAEEKLEKHFAQLDRFFSVAMDLLCIADTNGYFLKVNRAWQDTLGYDIRYLENTRFLDLVHPDDMQSTLDAMRSLSEQKPVLNFTNRFRHKDGHYVYIEWRSYPEDNLIYAAARDVTKREQLEAYQSQLTAIIESSRDGIIGKSVDGVITSWNPAAEAIYGYTAAEIIGQPVSRIIPQDLMSELAYNQERALRGEFIGPYETVRLHKDGTRIDVELTLSPIKDQSGKLIGVSTINRPTGALKQVQDALRESEARYEAIVNAMSEGVVLQLRGGTICACNPAAEQILGLTAEQMMGLTSIDSHWRAVHEDGSPFPGESHPAMVTLATGQPQMNVIMGVYKPNNVLTWILVNSQPLIQEGDTLPYAVVATFVDITERKHQEQALKQSEERFSRAFNNSPVAMVISTTDDDFPIYVDVNDAYAKLTGYSVDELIGKTFIEVNTVVQNEGRTKRLNTLATERSYTTSEAQIRLRTGEIRDILISAQRIELDGQDYDIELLIDITERKQVERQTLMLQLEKERVYMLSQFVEQSSHEFRTPLSIIQSSLYFLEKSDSPEIRHLKAKVIENQIGRITRLVDMLQKTMYLASSNTLKFRRTDVKHILNELVDRYRLKADQANVALELAKVTNSVSILVDIEQVYEAIGQIIDNAIRFTPAPGKITVCAEQADKHVIIQVKDTGNGISSVTLPRIFERFYRMDKAHSSPGFGLGLPIAQTIIEKHGGRIEVESQVGTGSTFRIILPIDQS